MPSHAFLVTAGGALIACAALAWVLQRRAIARRRPRRFLRHYPSVTVIRPIRGLDTGAAENIEAALSLAYPGEVETLFVFDDPTEPALPLLQRALAALGERGGPRRSARVLFCGAPPEGVTGKLNAMRCGYREARGVLVAFADSDIRPAPHTLTVLVETLLSGPDVGAAFAPVVATQPPKTVGDAACALMLNGMYGATAATLSWLSHDELPFIMGQFMVLRREALEAMGGLEATQGQLVDDMFIGAMLHRVGLRNRVAPVSVPVIQDGITLGAFLRLYHKWMAFGRAGLPQRAFKVVAYLPGVIFFAGLALAGLAWSAGDAEATALALGASGVIVTSLLHLHRALGGAPLPWRHVLVPVALLLSAPFALLSTRVYTRVDWRGREYVIDGHARVGASAEERPQPTSSKA